MHAIDFEGTNVTLGKPADMTEEQCFPLRAAQDVDTGGYPYFLTAWMPNADDVKALIEGRPIFIKQVGTGFHPLAVFTCNAEGEGNFE